MSHDVRRHVLRIRVPLSMIQETPWRVSSLLAGCLILRAEARYDYDAMEYVACRGDFPYMPSGFEILNVIVRETSSDILSCMWASLDDNPVRDSL